MSRPKKNSCDYFPHDAGMRNHPKVKVLRQKFINGYAIWNMLLEYLTAHDGNEFEKSKQEYMIISGDFGYEATEISGVVDCCIELEMLFEKNGFIYSESLEENLAPVYTKRKKAKEISKRQQRKNGQYIEPRQEPEVIPEPIPEEPEIIFAPEVVEIPPEIKKAAPTKTKKEKPVPAPKPYWNLWVDRWFTFHEENKREKPSFKGLDPKYLEVIYEQCRKRMAEKGKEWTEELSMAAWNTVLKKAFADKFLNSHFLLKNLEAQFDKIIQPTQQNGTNNIKQSTSANTEKLNRVVSGDL